MASPLRTAVMRKPVFLLAMPALVVFVAISGRAQGPGVGAARGAASKFQTPNTKEIMAKIGKGPQALTPAIGQALKAQSPDWAAVQAQAKEYAELAAALAKNSPRMGTKESWDQLTADFAEAANDLAKAANEKDLSAAKTAHDQLANSCMACHGAHRGRGGPGMGGGPPGGFGGGPPGRFGGGPPGRPGFGQGPGPGGPPPGAGTPKAEERGPAGPATTPEGTVQAFLVALKESDAEALARLVVRRPVAELMVRTHKKTLDGLVGQKLTDTELETLAKEFEGASIDGRAASAGGGKVAVTLAQGSARRKVYVLREGEHWRVMDYGMKNNATAKAKTGRAR
jgi:hypothetical protein